MHCWIDGNSTFKLQLVQIGLELVVTTFLGFYSLYQLFSNKLLPWNIMYCFVYIACIQFIKILFQD